MRGLLRRWLGIELSDRRIDDLELVEENLCKITSALSEDIRTLDKQDDVMLNRIVALEKPKPQPTKKVSKKK
jgi:hypothetical protein